MDDIRVIASDERVVADADTTSGMVREKAIADEGVWVGVVRAAPQRPSGWHHHGDYDSYLYVMTGEVGFEWGAGGAESVVAHAGDFVHVPKGVIHREVNPSEDEGSIVLIRVGSGPPVFNVDGPTAD